MNARVQQAGLALILLKLNIEIDIRYEINGLCYFYLQKTVIFELKMNSL